MLVTGLTVSSRVFAQDYHDDDQGHRYYDASHKDYHTWSSDEDQHFHAYLREKHQKDHDWEHASKREQQAYWSWRHDHQ